MRLLPLPPLTVFSLIILSSFLHFPLASAQQNNQGGGGLSALPALTDTKGANVPTSQTSAAAKPSATKKESNTKPTAAPSQLPDLTSSGAASTNDGGLTNAPKLAGDDYPAPTVPPTADAPYMHRSNYPEGTVFICVGAALGFIALLILAWRGLVAWSIHRSVKRAANMQAAKYSTTTSDYSGMSERKSGRKGSGYGYKRAGSQAPPPAFYNHGHGSTLSIDQLNGHTLGVVGGTAGSGGGKSGARTPASARGSLFFSPTAGAGNGLNNAPSTTTASTAPAHNPSSARASAYLPAGYYASGTSAGTTNAPQHHARDSIALSNLNPNAPADRRSRRYSNKPPSFHANNAALLGNGNDNNHSPPGSPSLAPSSRGAEIAFGGNIHDGARRPSTGGGLSILQQDQGVSSSRAPSAYLENLFDEHTTPSGNNMTGHGGGAAGQGQMEAPIRSQMENEKPTRKERREERRERRESRGEKKGERRESRGENNGERSRRRRSHHQ